MRRWDIFGAVLGGVTAVLDLWLFEWVGLDVRGLVGSIGGTTVLGSFVVGYAALGFALGRLFIARQRARADARRIGDQLRALEESRARLASNEKLAALGRLAAGIAHEVRNPLGVIRASASLVEESLDRGSDDQRACELIRDEIDRLDGLIGALLAFAKPARMALAEIEVEPVIAHAIRLATESLGNGSLSPGSERRSFGVNARLELDRPVRADGDLLTQLVLGLLVNAAEAGAGAAEVRASRHGDRLRVEVADDGPGVDANDASKIFEPFFTTKPTGTGLGLPMALRIAEAHGGTLELAPGRGLREGGAGGCFSFELPLGGPAIAAEAA